MPPTLPHKSRKVLYIVLAIIIVVVLSAPIWMPVIVNLQENKSEPITFNKIPPVSSNSQVIGSTTTTTEFTYDILQFQVPWTGTTTVRHNDATTIVVVSDKHESVFVMNFTPQQGQISYDEYSRIINSTPSDPKYYAAKHYFSTGHPYDSFSNTNGVKGYTSQISTTSSMAVAFTPSGNSYSIGLGNMSQDEIQRLLESLKEVQ